jgi:SAM-dependent methyltransferase
MDTTRATTDDQAARWKGSSGQAWVETQALMDATYRPLERLLLEPVHAGRVLDVGCGTGSTTVAAAERVGAAGGSVTGVDISAAMLAAARTRADKAGVRVDLVEADAQEHPFEPATFDTVMSRFGVMFFADPTRAFANLRRATSAGGGLRMVVWRSASDNPFMTTAQRAAATLLPDLPTRGPDEPGPFALADPDRLTGILRDAGWAGIDLRATDTPCVMPEAELVTYFTRFSAVGQAFPGLDEETRAAVIETVRPAYDPFVDGAEVRFTAACWLVTARASG